MRISKAEVAAAPEAGCVRGPAQVVVALPVAARGSAVARPVAAQASMVGAAAARAQQGWDRGIRPCGRL